MSSEAQPITPARFTEALEGLPASSLALKVLELRNSIAHLDYSNAELKPYAEGTASAIENSDSNAIGGGGGGGGQPDQDCIDAIAENEAVIQSMQERISLIRAEVERRGLDWREFQGKEDDVVADAGAGPVAEETRVNGTTPAPATTAPAGDLANGVNGHVAFGGNGTQQQQQQHEAWRDGTFQTGTIHGMTDEDLLRQLTERMPLDDEDGDAEGGMHL
ncbi:hypothetical protein SLS62_005170 [Diatrype stigma]|uniref:Secondary alcohol dehydrogenase protein n=1 Tax=Diatrype stigma TaxID=117547 RepID=A0AAN9V3I3_9PEZI